jgi:GYF domain 2
MAVTIFRLSCLATVPEHGAFMTIAWTINVEGRVYGPYSQERLRSFASEGRLAPTSLIAQEGAAEWREAREEPEFCDLFTQVPKETPHVSAPVVVPKPAPTPSAPVSADVPEGKLAQFAIVIDIKSHSSGGFEQAITSLGSAHRLVHNVWILSTTQTVNAVRNRLVPELGKSDSLFVVDASRGKAAWFNFGPDADVRIRRVWQKAS